MHALARIRGSRLEVLRAILRNAGYRVMRRASMDADLCIHTLLSMLVRSYIHDTYTHTIRTCIQIYVQSYIQTYRHTNICTCKVHYSRMHNKLTNCSTSNKSTSDQSSPEQSVGEVSHIMLGHSTYRYTDMHASLHACYMHVYKYNAVKRI